MAAQAPTTMEAVVMQNGALSLQQVSTPTPGPREVLVKVLATGICGSDLHCLAHAPELLSSTKAATGVDLFDIDDPVVMGHEFCAEVVSYGPDSRASILPGTRVCSPGLLLRDQPILIGYGGPDIPGGYAEYMLLSEDLLFPVPDSVSDEEAALVEPLSVALHAVNRGKIGAHDVPLVIGCGPIGLAVIAILKMRGLGPIVAADFSPSRRAMAATLGAEVVVDPGEISPYEAWRDVAATDVPEQMAPTNLMFPPGLRPATVFECVGVPGVIQQILDGAPANSTVVVAGFCMQQDTFYPTYAMLKEIDLVFSMAYSPEEYGEVLGHLASRALNVEGFVTSRVGLSEVADAFKRLSDPEQDAKIIVLPGVR